MQEDILSALVNLDTPEAGAEKALSTVLRSGSAERSFEGWLRQTLQMRADSGRLKIVHDGKKHASDHTLLSRLHAAKKVLRLSLRPRHLHEYIGQDKVKENIEIRFQVPAGARRPWTMSPVRPPRAGKNNIGHRDRPMK